MSYWYVVKVLPGKERQIEEHFNTEISNGELSTIKRFICPTEKSSIVLKNKKTTRDSVIYTGYLYFETDEKLSDAGLKHIGANPLIMGILGDRKPVLLNKNDVAKILKDETLENHIESKKFIFEKGNEVKITDGAFNGFTGTIIEVKGEVVQVEVKIFGVGSKIQLRKSEITKL